MDVKSNSTDSKSSEQLKHYNSLSTLQLERATSVFQPKEIAHSLHLAFRHAVNKPDLDCIINILSTHTNSQIQELVQNYRSSYHMELSEEIETNIPDAPHLRDALIAVITSPIVYDSQLLHRSLFALGCDYQGLNEIIATRTFEELKLISDQYYKMYQHTLLKDIESKVNGLIRTCYENLLQSEARKLNTVNDQKQIEKDCERLYKATQRTGGDYYEFIDILTKNSPLYIRQLNECYKAEHSQSLPTIIEIYCRDKSLKSLLMSLVLTPEHFLADCLYKAGSSELIAILVSNRERCLKDLNEWFFQLHSINLRDWLKDGITGSKDEKQFLLNLVENFTI